MAVIVETIRRNRPTALLALGLTANLAPIATFAAVLPEISAAWGLSASGAGEREERDYAAERPAGDPKQFWLASHFGCSNGRACGFRVTIALFGDRSQG